jgi:hypothetical protein
VVDLSAMTQAEPLVAAPAGWADEVYGYELDLPAAVGLTVGSRSPGDIYTYGLIDYVNNLQSFVDGYPQARPSAASKNDSEVLFLPPPTPGNIAPLTDGFGWLFFCPTTAGSSSGTWVNLPASGQLSDTCGKGIVPVRARLSFSLDPWGRVDADLVHPPVTNIYNKRWGQLAVNLMGTDVYDCSATPTPQCESQRYVPYNLRHVGPAWTTSYEQQWRALDVPVGVIETGKAVAAELLVDYTGWTNPYLSGAAKLEYTDRPLGGTYELDLNPNQDPSVRLDNVQGIQVLLMSSSWVRQE